MVEIGLQIEPQFGFTYSRIRDLATLCESVGFNSLWCSDHFFLDGQSEERDCWDVWTVLTGLAVETSTLRLGSLVTCVSYRPPPVLAKMAVRRFAEPEEIGHAVSFVCSDLAGYFTGQVLVVDGGLTR